MNQAYTYTYTMFYRCNLCLDDVQGDKLANLGYCHDCLEMLEEFGPDGTTDAVAQA